MGVTADSTSSVASLAQAYLEAVGHGEGVAGELHAGLPWLGVYRGLDEARAFLISLLPEVVLAFGTGGRWSIQTDGMTQTVTAGR